jgi:hypothetical protein
MTANPAALPVEPVIGTLRVAGGMRLEDGAPCAAALTSPSFIGPPAAVSRPRCARRRPPPTTACSRSTCTPSPQSGATVASPAPSCRVLRSDRRYRKVMLKFSSSRPAPLGLASSTWI